MSIGEPKTELVVVSREAVLESVAAAFAVQSVEQVNQLCLPFGELRWTGWKTRSDMVGFVGQLMLWIYDYEDRGRQDSPAVYYAVSLPGGVAKRYNKGDSFEIANQLWPEDFMLAHPSGRTPEQYLLSEFLRGLQSLVDVAMDDESALIGKLLWRGVNRRSPTPSTET